MRTLALIVLLGFCYSESALVYPKECSYGSSYWCHSLRNAKVCGAVQHCIQAVWEKQTMPKDNDGVCQICLDMVTQARDTLKSNDTQEMIKQVFEGSCNLIPIQLVRHECIDLADGFIPELIETLSSEMDPEVVCATAGLCNSIRVDKLIKQYLLTHKEIPSTGESYDMKVKDDKFCTDCHTFLSDVAKAVKTHSRAEVLDHLLSICGRVSSLSDGCRMLVQSNFDVIYDFLAYDMRPEEICDLFGLCGSFIQKRVVHEDIPCEFCEDIVKHWRDQLASNTTVEQFKEILVGICAHTGNFQQECDSLVDQYYDALYSFLISQVEPEQICTIVGLCGKHSVFKQETPMWTLFGMRPQDQLLLPADDLDISNNLIGQDESNSYKKENMIGTDEANSYKENLVGTDEANSYKEEKSKINIVSHGSNGVIDKKSDTCVMCEFTLHYLQDLLTDKPTKKQVEDALKQVCALLPHNLEEQCDDYIDAYGDQLIQLLILEMDPATICPMLGLCPGKALTLLEDVSCTLCEYAMTQLDQMLEDKKTEESIRSALETVCSIMPKTVRHNCKEFVDQYTDQIVHLLIEDFTPTEVCEKLGLCNNNKVSEKSEPEMQLPISRMFVSAINHDIERPVNAHSHHFWDQSFSCVMCEFIVARLDKALQDKTVEDEIKEDVSKVCLLLPTTLMNDCLGFIEEYGQGMLEMLLSELDPSVVCRDIKLCKANLAFPKATVEVKDDSCSQCVEVVEMVNKADKVPVNQLPKSVCGQIEEKKLRKSCRVVLLQHGQNIYDLLEDLKTPKKVCQALLECPAGKKSLLIGASRCTWGPSYWCRSPMHAETCKATKHCQEKVWGKPTLNFEPRE